MWVPGCATGEEVYSIAICLLERAGELSRNPSLQIFATDLSESALEKARAGLYLENIAQDVSAERLRRFFTRVDGHYQISKTIREMCVFARHDLAKDPPFSRMDLISCRNVLIYMEPRLQERVFATFHYALNPGGFLVLGTSESVGASSAFLAPLDEKHRIYSRKETAAPAAAHASRRALPRDRATGEAGRPHAAEPRSRAGIPTEADRVLLDRYAPASVVVDEGLDILEFRGDTASLPRARARPGEPEPDQDGPQGAPAGAAPDDPGGAKEERACPEGGPADPVPRAAPRREPRGPPAQGGARSAACSSSSRARGAAEAAAERPRRRRGRAAAAGDREIARLRQELARGRRSPSRRVMEEHDAALEELQSSNEEAVSSNEELQSVNEELQTAKEEVQSANEELATLNRELQERNVQLGQANDALKRSGEEIQRALDYANAIVATVRGPLLIMDGELRVEKANRAYYDTFGVRPEETEGRLLYELGGRPVGLPRPADGARRRSCRRTARSKASRWSGSSPGSAADDGAQRPAPAQRARRERTHPPRHRGPHGAEARGAGARRPARPGAGGP